MELHTYAALTPGAIEQIDKGAFLTVGTKVCNPMTIGWAQFGVVWGK